MAISSDAISGLVGVVTGSAITGGFQLGIAVRAERRERRAALRSIRSELVIGRSFVKDGATLNRETWKLLGPLIKKEAWVRYGDGLARDRRVEYGKLNAAYHAVDVVLARATVGTPPQDVIDETLETFDRAIEHLAALGKSRRLPDWVGRPVPPGSG